MSNRNVLLLISLAAEKLEGQSRRKRALLMEAFGIMGQETL